MNIADFDFTLNPNLIALTPARPRDKARLLVVGPGRLEDRSIADLPTLLRAGDILVFNNTKVIAAHLLGFRPNSIGAPTKIEVLLHQRKDAEHWQVFIKGAKKLRRGDRLIFGDGILEARLEEKNEAGAIILAFNHHGEAFDQAIAAHGVLPLPPYIARRRGILESDSKDYQTIFARHPGAVAAPTAGLHFTPHLLESLQQAGIDSVFVTLHVGAGTFFPIKTERIEDHKMHHEWGEVPAETCQKLKDVRAKGGRIIAVGTTSARLLEASKLEAFCGHTDIFIIPGYRFCAIDGLITNFHLPRSTLLMLISAFSGLKQIQQAYQHAMDQNYRFYSYGDASLLLPHTANHDR